MAHKPSLNEDSYNPSDEAENNKKKEFKPLTSSSVQGNFDDQYLASCLVKLARTSYDPVPARTVTSNAQQEEDTHSFPCSICGKILTSYQALGGHKSGHRNDKNPSDFSAVKAKGSRVSAVKPSGKSHQCQVCHKFFPNGQALGGHKRSHLGVPLATGNGHRKEFANSDPSHSPAAKVTTSETTLSDHNGSSSHESEEEIDLELRLGRSIDVIKMESKPVENNELENPTPEKKLCLSMSYRLSTRVSGFCSFDPGIFH